MANGFTNVHNKWLDNENLETKKTNAITLTAIFFHLISQFWYNVVGIYIDATLWHIIIKKKRNTVRTISLSKPFSSNNDFFSSFSSSINQS